MQALIDDLLTFSRVGRTTDSFVAVSLDDCVQTALDGSGRAWWRAPAPPSTSAPLPVVPGDPVLLTSLWQNLLGNAVKFHGDDPSRRERGCPTGRSPVAVLGDATTASGSSPATPNASS